MAYIKLDENTLISYLNIVPSLADLLTENSQAVEIGDGNLNFVYIVDGLKNNIKLVVKQAVPYLRCAGESYLLAKERMIFESKSLQKFSSLVPQHVPHIHHVDLEMALVVMQCLDQHIIMRRGVIAKTVYPNFVAHITDFMAATLFKTSSLYLSGKEKRDLMAEYIANDELCKITEDFVFTTPYMVHETNPENLALQTQAQTIHNDSAFKLEVLKLKNKFMNQTDALVHGDLHTGSIMINQTETFVIDSEFAFFGPIGFDVGALIANLLLAWVSHFERSKDSDYQAWLLETTLNIYQQFEQKFIALWDAQREQASGLVSENFCSQELFKQYQQFYMQQVLQDSMGFTGLKMARRILGIAGVADIRDINDAAARARAEKLALSIAKQLVMQRKNIATIADILPILETMSSAAQPILEGIYD